jgi:hypothetical protein
VTEKVKHPLYEEFEGLVVRTMWGTYDGFVETRTTRRGKVKYRWVIERYFAGRDVYDRGWWTSSFDKAVRHGLNRLRGLDPHQHERVELDR